MFVFFPLISMLFLFGLNSAAHKLPWNQAQGSAALKKNIFIESQIVSHKQCLFKPYIWMNKNRILGGMQQPLIFVVSRLWPPREETLVFVTMQRHLSLSLSCLPFFLWEVNLDSENRKKGPLCDSKTRQLILDSYTHTRPCPCFLQFVQRTPLDQSPQGTGVRDRENEQPSLIWNGQLATFLAFKASDVILCGYLWWKSSSVLWHFCCMHVLDENNSMQPRSGALRIP